MFTIAGMCDWIPWLDTVRVLLTTGLCLVLAMYLVTHMLKIDDMDKVDQHVLTLSGSDIRYGMIVLFLVAGLAFVPDSNLAAAMKLLPILVGNSVTTGEIAMAGYASQLKHAVYSLVFSFSILTIGTLRNGFRLHEYVSEYKARLFPIALSGSMVIFWSVMLFSNMEESTVIFKKYHIDDKTRTAINTSINSEVSKRSLAWLDQFNKN